MMYKILVTISMITVLAISGGCKKEEDETKVSKAEILRQNQWKLTSAETNPSFGGIDPLTFLGECVTDNLLTFATNNILEVDEGAEKCNENAPQTQKGTWSLNQDETRLSLEYGTYVTDAEITKLTQQQVDLKSTVDYNGYSITILSTFTSL